MQAHEQLNDHFAPDGVYDSTKGAISGDTLSKFILSDYAKSYATLTINDTIISGPLNLTDASICTGLSFNSCAFTNLITITNADLISLLILNSKINGISGRNVKIRGDLRLDGSTSKSGIHLPIAKIQGSLHCRGLEVSAASCDDFDAFLADGIHITGDAFLNYQAGEKEKNFTAQGTVRFIGAQIGGDLDLQNAIITASYIPSITEKRDMAALYAERAVIKGNLYLRNSTIRGVNAVTISNGDIGADLDAEGANLLTIDTDDDKDPWNDTRRWRDWPRSLHAPHLHIAGDAIFHSHAAENDTRDFSAPSAIDLRNAKIEGDLIFRSKSGKTIIKAIIMLGTRVRGALNAYKNLSIEYLDLRNAKIGSLIDSADCWPEKGKLLLNNFEFENFGGDAPVDVESRCEWLSLQYMDDQRDDTKDFWPQPYEQTAKALRNAGHSSEAKDILIEKQIRAGYADRIGVGIARFIPRIWHRIMGATTRYGYHPFLALLYMVGFIILGAFLFDAGHSKGYITPSNKVKTDFASIAPPAFNKWAFSAEVFIPIVNLRHREYWLINDTNPTKEECFLFLYYSWLHIALGWFFTTLAVAGFTGLIKRD